MRHAPAVAVCLGLFVVIVVMVAVSPDLAFWVLFALMAMAAPFVVVVGTARWLVKHHKGGKRAR